MAERKEYPPGDPRHGGVDAADSIVSGEAHDIPDMGPTPFDDSGNVKAEVVVEAERADDEPEAVERVIDQPAPPPAKDPVEKEIEAGVSSGIEGVDLNLVSADELDREEVPDEYPDEEEKPRPVVPQVDAAGPVHACGLPKSLMAKKTMSEYLRRHTVSMRHRTAMELTSVERRLYEVYAQAMRNKRAQKSHFVAALRLWKAGYPINPKESLDLNNMKVGE